MNNLLFALKFLGSDVKPGLSLFYFLLGNVIVLLVLAFLVVVVMAYGGILNKIFDKVNARKAKKAAAKANKASTVPVADAQPAANNDTEVVAAITAAITAVYESESPDGKAPAFTISNIAPVQVTTPANKEVPPFRVKRIY